MDVSPLHSANKPSEILDIWFPNSTLFSSGLKGDLLSPFTILRLATSFLTEVKQFDCNVISVSPSSIIAVFRFLQFLNAQNSMKVTLLGIITDVSPLQPKKALFSIDTTEYFILFHVILAGMIRLLFVISLYPVTAHSWSISELTL